MGQTVFNIGSSGSPDSSDSLYLQEPATTGEEDLLKLPWLALFRPQRDLNNADTAIIMSHQDSASGMVRAVGMDDSVNETDYPMLVPNPVAASDKFANGKPAFVPTSTSFQQRYALRRKLANPAIPSSQWPLIELPEDSWTIFCVYDLAAGDHIIGPYEYSEVSGDYGLRLMISGGSDIQLRTGDLSSNGDSARLSDTTQTASGEHYFVLTFSTANGLNLYVDNTRTITENTSGDGDLTALTERRIMLFGHPDAINTGPTGKIGHLGILNREATSDEITTMESFAADYYGIT